MRISIYIALVLFFIAGPNIAYIAYNQVRKIPDLNNPAIPGFSLDTFDPELLINDGKALSEAFKKSFPVGTKKETVLSFMRNTEFDLIPYDKPQTIVFRRVGEWYERGLISMNCPGWRVLFKFSIEDSLEKITLMPKCMGYGTAG